MTGKCWAKSRPSAVRASRNTRWPSARWRHTARATTSRGASSPPGTPAMKRVPGLVDQRRALATHRFADQASADALRHRARSGGTGRTPGRPRRPRPAPRSRGPGQTIPVGSWCGGTTRRCRRSPARHGWSAAPPRPAADAASTPLTMPSTTISRRASYPSSTVIEGVSANRDRKRPHDLLAGAIARAHERCGVGYAPLPGPARIAPAGSRSKRTPYCSTSGQRPGRLR